MITNRKVNWSEEGRAVSVPAYVPQILSFRWEAQKDNVNLPTLSSRYLPLAVLSGVDALLMAEAKQLLRVVMEDPLSFGVSHR